MTSHIRFLAVLNGIRALCGLVLGGVFIYFSDTTRIPLIRIERLEDGDGVAFLVVGWVIVVLALLRFLQVVVTLVELRLARHDAARGSMSRRFGLGLSILDLLDLTLFPLTTAWGLYGFLVYRHSDTIDLYEGRLSA